MNAQSSALQQAGLNALKAGRLSEAIQALQQSAGADPECCDTYCYLGAAFAKQGNFESARRAFGRAVQIQPQSARVRYNLGHAHEMAGDVEACRACYEAALEIDPNYAAAREALTKLPPKVVSMSALASPGGAVRLPGAHGAGKEEEGVATPTVSYSPADLARLAAPQGHLHMMGAQASEADHPE